MERVKFLEWNLLCGRRIIDESRTENNWCGRWVIWGKKHGQRGELGKIGRRFGQKWLINWSFCFPFFLPRQSGFNQDFVWPCSGTVKRIGRKMYFEKNGNQRVILKWVPHDWEQRNIATCHPIKNVVGLAVYCILSFFLTRHASFSLSLKKTLKK